MRKISKLEVRNPVLKRGYHYLTSDFKTRNENRKTHNGMDFIGKNKSIDEVIAIEEGVVVVCGYDKGGAGYWLSIETNGIQARYFHLKKGSILVKKGELVKKGQVLATMGDTGNANGIHLHFAIYKDGKYVDPYPYLVNEDPFHVKDDFKEFVCGVQKSLKLRETGVANQYTLSKTITISTTKNFHHPVVKVLQIYLKKLGYDLGKYGIDGKFGPDMKKVIKEYQRNVVGLTGGYVDGVLTARMYTWRRLLELY